MGHIASLVSSVRPKAVRSGLASLAAVGGVVALLIGPMQVVAETGTTIRPISDFTAMQGTFCPVHPDLCTTVSPAYINFTAPGQGRIAVVDFAAREPVAAMLGTTTSGTVTERPLADGRVEDHVLLKTHNALVYVREWDPATNVSGAFLFGRNPAEVQAGGAPGIGDSSLDVTLINDAPGAPLPDLIRFLIDLPLTDLKMIGEQASATGPLRAAFGVPDGTGGRAKVTETGLIGTAIKQEFKGRLYDAFPAESIDLQAVGR